VQLEIFDMCLKTDKQPVQCTVLCPDTDIFTRRSLNGTQPNITTHWEVNQMFPSASSPRNWGPKAAYFWDEM